jgi:hypothetical protein
MRRASSDACNKALTQAAPLCQAGQRLNDMWEGDMIPLDSTGYVSQRFDTSHLLSAPTEVSASQPPRFQCPPTTFFSPNRHFCVSCPYPYVSAEASVGVGAGTPGPL